MLSRLFLSLCCFTIDQHHNQILYSSLNIDNFYESFFEANNLPSPVYQYNTLDPDSLTCIVHLVPLFKTVLLSLFSDPIQTKKQHLAEIETAKKIRKFTQLKLKDALTKQVAKDLKNVEEGTPAYDTIINMIKNKVKQIVGKQNCQSNTSGGVPTSAPKKSKKQTKNSPDKAQSQKLN